MEQRLAEYRARKANEKLHRESSPGGRADPPGRKTFLQTMKEKIHNVFNKWKTAELAETEMSDAATERTPIIPEDSRDGEPDTSMWRTVLLVKFLLWLVLLGLFVELEFGQAYFILSMFYWLYEGTRRPGLRKTGEKSAYSVFNPGCEAIQGTLTAEQFERELQYKPLAGR